MTTVGSALEDPQVLLRAGVDIVQEEFDGLEHPVELLRTALQDEGVRRSFVRACCFDPGYDHSWLHGPDPSGKYQSLALAAEALPADALRELLFAVVSTTSPTVPFDYRALAASRLRAVDPGPYGPRLGDLAASYGERTRRPRAQKLTLRTDGIDHLFAVPPTIERRVSLLRQATERATRANRALLAARAAGLPDPADATAPAERYSNPDVEALIAADIDIDLIRPTDYLVRWDELVAMDPEDQVPLTLAEVLRVVLLAPEFALPDRTIRPALIDFLRATLKTSGRSIVGLSAGVFHVEHGTQEIPSLFYLGRDAVLGKGCVIDCVGGAVLQSQSFLGGGFIPILVHTHKHIRPAGAPGAAERKVVLPCVFVAERGARLPMSAVGLYESADYLDRPSPHAGLLSFPVASGPDRRAR